MKYKTGKLAAKASYKTLRLRSYLTDALPAPPTSYDAAAAAMAKVGITSIPVMFPMDNNDTLGCCTIAAVAHAMAIYFGLVGAAHVVSADTVKAVYLQLTGGQDCGCAELDVLDYWKSNPVAGEQILSYASIDKSNSEHIKQSVMLFGGVYIGIQVPVSMQDDFEAGRVMQVGPLTQDGHAVYISGYDAETVSILTWGGMLKMTWACFFDCCDEAYAILPPQANQPGFAVGFDSAQLQSDFAAMS